MNEVQFRNLIVGNYFTVEHKTGKDVYRKTHQRVEGRRPNAEGYPSKEPFHIDENELVCLLRFRS